MLFLTGQFEAAIEFLATGAGARHLPHAVHLAAAMHEHNLLAVSQSVLAPLISVDPADKPPAKRLNFARLILLYVKRFESSDPKESLHYLFLLRYNLNLHFFLNCLRKASVIIMCFVFLDV